MTALRKGFAIGSLVVGALALGAFFTWLKFLLVASACN